MKKYIIAFIIILVVVLGIRELYYFTRPDGSTIEIREAMIEKRIGSGAWEIASECEMDGYLLCGIYSDDKNGIAIFESAGNGKYKLYSTEWQKYTGVILRSTIINGEWYNLSWCNNALCEKAVYTYTFADERTEEVTYDIADMNVVIAKKPEADKFSTTVSYYDAEGNEYT